MERRAREKRYRDECRGILFFDLVMPRLYAIDKDKLTFLCSSDAIDFPSDDRVMSPFCFMIISQNSNDYEITAGAAPRLQKVSSQ